MGRIGPFAQVLGWVFDRRFYPERGPLPEQRASGATPFTLDSEGEAYTVSFELTLALADMDLYAHVRIIVGVVVSLGLTHLLRGIANLIQHPKKERIYWVHLAWVLFMFLYVLHFWWWEFWLRELKDWNLAIYLFTIFYAVLIYLICAMLFPDSLAGYSGYEDYFYSRRRWFFGLMIAIFALDLEDTFLKGRQYYLHLGIEYPIRAAMFIVACAIALVSRNRRYHQVFAVASVVYQLSYIFRLYAREFQ
jgi:hypothetical protein